IKNFIKRNTPTRPDLKSELVSLQAKERQRLESLRKKQEAEEQRKKKVEEEKRRRQAEMKQKREERLRKALQARERVEQMEEEKKKRMEQKILQNDEKVRLSQVREEKVAGERSKKKLSKKHGEADVRKEKAPSVVRATLGPSCRVFFFLLQEEDEFEQQELLQKRREDEVKEKGKKVLELKNLVEQQKVEQVKERNDLILASYQEEDGLQERPQQRGEEEKIKRPEALAAASGTWLSRTAEVSRGSSRACRYPCPGEASPPARLEGLHPALIDASLWFQKSISTSCLGAPKGTRESRSPKVNENNYGMDLNSDDSTDDENEPRKPVPAWADGSQLNQAILHQYYHPVNVDQLFGLIPVPKLEDIFGKSKPRYFKRTSSAVWHSPP
ncbi:INCE protein, partial [Sagittarius serpentarius]|nr:INCE protein [Sagittarius serpentarius]